MLQTKDRLPKESWLDQPLAMVVKLDWEKGLYALLITLALISRLWDLGARVMSHDETVHIQWSWYLFQGRGYSHTPLSHGPFLFHATALSYYLFGATDFSARLVVAIMGVILVALPYMFRRWLGRGGALVASFLFLISPSLLYYSRYIRHDIPVIVWSLIAIAAIFRYLDRAARQQPGEGNVRVFMVLAAALSLMFATKEVAFIYVATFGVFLVLLFLVRLGAPRWRDPASERRAAILLWIAAGALLIATLTSGLGGIMNQPQAGAQEAAPATLDEELQPEIAGVQTATAAATLLGGIARWCAMVVFAAVAGYVGLLALAAPSHRRLVLAVVGLSGVIVLTMLLLLFSLYPMELFPIRFRDCGQVPVPGATPGEMSCSEENCEIIQGRCQRPIPVVAGDNVSEFDESGTRIAIQLTRLEILIIAALIGIFTLMAGAGAFVVLNRLMPFQRGERPAWDLILFIGSFSLPFLSAFAINELSHIASRLFFGIGTGFNALDYSEAGLLRSAGFVFITIAVSVAVGLSWDWRRWLPAAAAFFMIFIVLFTTVFTNGNGLASGAVGSLGYWLEQQNVQRGSQPVYYYGLLVPLYEYLPLIGFVAAAIYLMVRGLKPKPPGRALRANAEASQPQDAAPSDAQTTVPPEAIFVRFLLFWTVATWVAYTIAGEKMPWLTTHFAVPMALTTGWVVGKLIGGVDWRDIVRKSGWIIALIAPVGLAALVQTGSPWLRAATARPFSGYGLGQLNATMQFLAAFMVLLASAYAVHWIRRRIGPSAVKRMIAIWLFAVLALLTIRSAWRFSYINHDYASEYLVYAHSTPDVREVMEQIEDISRRTTGELSLDIGYTADGSYPFIWYLRDYPNATQLPNPPSRPDVDKSVIVAGDKEWSGIEPYLGDNYTCNRYNFLWWPMQDYYSLTWDRVRYALTNPEMRAALWDIIFRRDYRKYEQATDKTVRLSEWPLRDRFRFCIRRDVASRVWSENAGPVALVPEMGEIGPDLPDYTGLEQPAAAEFVISALGSFGSFSGPHDIAVGADGSVYTVDSNNHRVVKLSPDGQVQDTWDSTWWRGLQSWKPGCLDAADHPLALGDGEFCEPWGITVGPNGNVYVADTWNHRIQVFTPSGEFLGKFGIFGQSGSSVSSAPSQFYGPRDLAVDTDGTIYVTDTGNKRIQVFDSSFGYLRSFGGPGIIEGRMEEPVGLAIGPDSLIYVADTWNDRIQVFTLQGVFAREWPITGWDSQSVANKPYIATDSAGRVYVSQPEGSRVVIFDDQGAPLAVLGGPETSLFRLPSGIVLDNQDRVWISDAVSQRLLRFPPLTFEQREDAP